LKKPLHPALARNAAKAMGDAAVKAAAGHRMGALAPWNFFAGRPGQRFIFME